MALQNKRLGYGYVKRMLKLKREINVQCEIIALLSFSDQFVCKGYIQLILYICITDFRIKPLAVGGAVSE